MDWTSHPPVHLLKFSQTVSMFVYFSTVSLDLLVNACQKTPCLCFLLRNCDSATPPLSNIYFVSQDNKLEVCNMNQPCEQPVFKLNFLGEKISTNYILLLITTSIQITDSSGCFTNPIILEVNYL